MSVAARHDRTESCPNESRPTIDEPLVPELAVDRRQRGRRAGRPAPEIPPRFLSPTQIRTYLACPRRWWFRYVAGIPEPLTFDSVRGSLVHEAFRRLMNESPPGGMPVAGVERWARERGDALLTEQWRESRAEFHRSRYTADLWQDGEEEPTRDLVARALDLHFRAVRDRIPTTAQDGDLFWASTRPLVPATPLALVEAPALHLRGQMDAVYDHGAGAEIVDLKTGRTGASADLLQAAWYWLLYEAVHHRPPVSAELWYLRTGELVRIEAPDRDRLLERLEEILVATTDRSESAHATTGFPAACGSCPFRAACPEHRQGAPPPAPGTPPLARLPAGRADALGGRVFAVGEPRTYTTEHGTTGRLAHLWLHDITGWIDVTLWHAMVEVHGRLRVGDFVALRQVFPQRSDRTGRLEVSVSHPWQLAVLRREDGRGAPAVTPPPSKEA